MNLGSYTFINSEVNNLVLFTKTTIDLQFYNLKLKVKFNEIRKSSLSKSRYVYITHYLGEFDPGSG